MAEPSEPASTTAEAEIDVEGETVAFAQRVVNELQAEVETHRQQLTNVTRLVSHWQGEAQRLQVDLAAARAQIEAPPYRNIVAARESLRVRLGDAERELAAARAQIAIARNLAEGYAREPIKWDEQTDLLTPTGATRYDQGFADGVHARDDELGQARAQIAAMQAVVETGVAWWQGCTHGHRGDDAADCYSDRSIAHKQAIGAYATARAALSSAEDKL